ncbi:glycohydrolase toxin TNT-related protein [Aeribacillus sp. FSL M8-0254]
MEDFNVKSGKAAPWFGRPGGGTQFVKYHENGKPYTINEIN